MAQFVHQYVKALVDGQVAAANMLNVNLYAISREQWVLLLTINTAIGMVMKKVSEVGGVTDQAWIDALNHALDATAQTPWPPDLLNQINPNPT